MYLGSIKRLVLILVSNEDVSATMYKDTLPKKELVNKTELSQAQVESKVNHICDSFLAVLEQYQYKNDYLQTMVTAHVSKVPPALESGLEMVGRLQGEYSSYLLDGIALTITKQIKTRSLTKLRSTFASLPMLTSYMTHPWDFTIWTLLCSLHNSRRR
jgi:hypothetical protein